MDWADECREAAKCFESGDYHAAADTFTRLCERSDIPDNERAWLGHNLAKCYLELRDTESARSSYEFAVTMALGQYVYLQELRAASLIELQLAHEAIAIYEHLLSLDLLLPEKREIFEHNLRILRQDAG